jgi:hypothetical protein
LAAAADSDRRPELSMTARAIPKPLVPAGSPRFNFLGILHATRDAISL